MDQTIFEIDQKFSADIEKTREALNTIRLALVNLDASLYGIVWRGVKMKNIESCEKYIGQVEQANTQISEAIDELTGHKNELQEHRDNQEAYVLDDHPGYRIGE